MTTFFSFEERRCKHCGNVVVDADFLAMLTEARKMAGIPFRITSWYRCPEYDQQVGGSGNHTKGKAVDIAYKTNKERAIIVFSLVKAGFQRIGINFDQKFIHVDTNYENPHPSLWKY